MRNRMTNRWLACSMGHALASVLFGMTPSRKRHPVSFVGISLAATLAAIVLGRLGFVQTIELKTYDLRVTATAHADRPSDDIVLVSIDDDSVKRMDPLVGRWPWPRAVHAWLIDYLASGGARVIVYDVLFAERDHQRFTIGDADWTGEESDAALVESTRKAGMVVHAAEVAAEELNDPSRAVATPLDDVPALNLPIVVGNCVERRPVITPPFPDLAKAARAIGHTLFTYDADGPLRRVSPVVRVGGRVVPALSLAAMMVAGPIDAASVRVDGDGLTIGPAPVPLVSDPIADYANAGARACRAMVVWRGPTQNVAGQPAFASFPAYSLLYSQQQLLEGQKPEIDPQTFRDKVVVVGVTAQGLHDVFTTPFAVGKMSGPEVHANLIDAWSSHRAIARAPWWQSLLLALALALVVCGVGLVGNAWATGLATALVAMAFSWVAVTLFARGIWVAMTVPTLALVFAFVGDLAWKYVIEGREKRQVKRLFSRYVAKDVYEQLLADPERAALGGARRTMTVLFSDVRGFTTLSEHSTPEEVVHQLNEYFTRMVQVVFEHRGTLDKFVGDMVMALYGAPLDDEDHAEHAVQTALAMSVALNELNQEWQRQGRAALDIGIGINTGDMVAGNIGSDTIMSYTVIGDAVNLGARLESLNKDYGTRIIISEATRARLKGRYAIRSLGEVVVKGKSQPVAIFEVTPS